MNDAGADVWEAVAGPVHLRVETPARVGADSRPGLPATVRLEIEGALAAARLTAAAEVEGEGGRRLLRLDEARELRELSRGPDGLRLEARFGEGEPSLRWSIMRGAGHVSFALAVVNGGAAPLRVHGLSPLVVPAGGLAVPGALAEWRAYKQGWTTVSASGSFSLAEPERRFFLRGVPFGPFPRMVKGMLYDVDEVMERRPGAYRSEWMTLLARHGVGGAPVVLLGFVGFRRHFSQLRVDLPAGALEAVAKGDGIELAPGARFETDPVLVCAAPDADAALARWCDEATRRTAPRRRGARLWCSWYSGPYSEIRERWVGEILEALPRYRDLVEHVQIDDGYQRAFGDWLHTNRRFPAGVEGLARSIEGAGFRPGIWTAPFAVSADTAVYREHPEWLVADERGRPKRAGVIPAVTHPRFFYALDTTHPDALAWLEGELRGLRERGFVLFKVDFLAAAAMAGRRRDRSATRAQAYARGMEAVRAGVGEDALVLGAIAPLLANLGFVDAQRVAPDVAFGRPRWRAGVQRLLGDRCLPGAENAIRTLLARSYLHGRFWVSDGDALVQRGLTPAEQETFATVSLLGGGVLGIGHDVARSPFRTEAVARIAAYRVTAVRVRDLLGADFPALLVADAERARAGAGQEGVVRATLLALLNPSPAGRRVVLGEVVPPAIAGRLGPRAHDLWRDRPIECVEGTALELAPHGCRLLAFEGGGADG